MKLIDWFRERKERREAKRMERFAPERGAEAETLQPLAEKNPDIVPAASRFTDVYQHFLKDLEAVEASKQADGEEDKKTDGEDQLS